MDSKQISVFSTYDNLKILNTLIHPKAICISLLISLFIYILNNKPFISLVIVIVIIATLELSIKAYVNFKRFKKMNKYYKDYILKQIYISKYNFSIQAEKPKFIYITIFDANYTLSPDDFYIIYCHPDSTMKIITEVIYLTPIYGIDSVKKFNIFIFILNVYTFLIYTFDNLSLILYLIIFKISNIFIASIFVCIFVLTMKFILDIINIRFKINKL